MAEPVLLVEKKDRIATITLNRPKQMNALSNELRIALSETFELLKDDTSIGVAILTGAGRAFCAGLDLKELAEGEKSLERPIEEMEKEGDLITPFRRFGRPVIGAINGVAITGGFELALACDILIASTEASFADTHARVGIMPGAGLSQKLSRLIGIYRAKEVSLTGNFVDARQALAWGLVNRLVSPEDLLPVCRSLAEDILNSPQDMVRKYKNIIDEGFDMPFGDGIALEKETSIEHFRTVTADLIAKRKEGIIERGRKQTE
jgi:enoyl-CoA hydratase